MKYYKVTAISNGIRVTVSQPNLTKQRAEHMKGELLMNRHFSEIEIEHSAMKCNYKRLFEDFKKLNKWTQK